MPKKTLFQFHLDAASGYSSVSVNEVRFRVSVRVRF